MKLYTKVIGNVTYTLPINKIVLDKNGMQIFNPTVDMLIEDGWTEYIQSNEHTEEESVIHAKQIMVDDILLYDSSDNVNIFYVNDIPMWLDKSTRAGLMLRLQAESAMNIQETTLWYGSFEFKLPVNTALQMLYALEIYASKCYDNTQFHISNVERMNSLEMIKNYDYTSGYPDALQFAF